MATEVLRHQDVLAERFRASFHRRRILPASGNFTNLVVNRKQHRRKTSLPKPDKRRFNAVAAEAKKTIHHHGSVLDPRRRVETTSGSPLSTCQVTLLRKGESLSSIASPIAGGNPSDPIRNPVDISSVTKQIRRVAGPPADIYAGSAFSISPSPRCVPLPSFFNKNSNDSATRDLRRLLRLE